MQLVVRRQIRASQEEVFAAWTDPQSIANWMCPGSVQTAEAQLDVQVGGKFRIVMKDGANEYVHTGEYRVVNRPSKLVFTWISAGTDMRETLVTIEISEAGDYCHLVLTHENLPTQDAVDRHLKGWTGIVGKLAEHLDTVADASGKEDFRITVRVAASSHAVYEQLSTAAGIRNWWTDYCEMDERVGGKAIFKFPKAGFHAEVKISRLDPDRCVEWFCVDSKHPEEMGFENPRDWIGTTLRFEISPLDHGCQLVFTHVGLAPLECFGVCSNTWATYLNGSLRGYLDRGAGNPYRERE